jgi:hypothetical protein
MGMRDENQQNKSKIAKGRGSLREADGVKTRLKLGQVCVNY